MCVCLTPGDGRPERDGPGQPNVGGRPWRRLKSHAALVAALLLWAAGAAGVVRADTTVALINPGMEAPYEPVNLNGGAISGAIANGWSDNSAWANATIQYSEETTDPHGGSACQKIAVTSVGTGAVQLIQPFTLEGGNLYTAAAWFRGTPGVQALLVIQQATAPYARYVEGSVELTSDWQPVTASGYIGRSEAAYLMVVMVSPGTLWVDDLALSFAPATLAPSRQPGPIPPSFFGMHVADLMQDQLRNAGFEPPFATVGVNNPISGEIAVNWSDNSSWGVPNPAVTYSEDTENPHGGTASQKVAVEQVPSGTAVQLVQPLTVVPGKRYAFSAWLRGDAGMQVNLILQDSNPPYTDYAYMAATLTGAWQRFAARGRVMDAGSVLLMVQAVRPGTFWVDDATFTNASGAPVSGGVPWPSAPFGTLRLWDAGTSWASLEPQKGEWNWQPLDDWVAAAEAHGAPDILLTLGQTPAWASSNPDDVNYIGAGAPAPPADIQDWRDYVTAVAQRYKGRIRYYEIWNEPNDPTYYTGSVAEMAELTAEAYRILKAVDPDNVVLSPAPYEPGYLDQLLKAGVGSNVDEIAFHLYETPPENTAAALFDVRLVMERDGAGAMPLWDTEGASGDSTVPEPLAAAYLVRKYLVDLAFGSTRFDWYAWGKATAAFVGTEENDPRKLTEAGRAFGIVMSWLKGATFTGASIGASGTWQIAVSWPRSAAAGRRGRSPLRWHPRPGSDGLIVWNPAATVQFAIPSALHAASQHDIFGHAAAVSGSTVAVGNAPLLLVGRRFPVYGARAPGFAAGVCGQESPGLKSPSVTPQKPGSSRSRTQMAAPRISGCLSVSTRSFTAMDCWS